MRIRQEFSSVFIAALLLAPLGGVGQISPGQGFSGAMAPLGMEGGGAGVDSPDSGQYAEGMRAINESRWADAVAIFANVVKQRSSHADGALYWKAYAENKQGQAKTALESCAGLHRDYPSSHWKDECGALEIEIRTKTGQPVQPKAMDSDDLKLLALNSLLQTDEARGLEQIQEILNGNSSAKLKQGALFIMGHRSTDETYDQIVRISYLEGDVRVARGQGEDRSTGATWEKAVVNLPIEGGFSLVTGTGRAEIELEDASTIYLGENSVLSFNDMHTTDGVPYSEMALLSGTVSLDVHPYVAGELFILRTPTDDLSVNYPHKFTARVNAYLDATTITPRGPGDLHFPMLSQSVTPGQTIALREGKRVDLPSSVDSPAFAEWDRWVAERVEQRSAAVAEVMKAANLTEPIPGMAELKGQGTFFDCAPYGTCWEPNTVSKPEQAGNIQTEPIPSVTQASSKTGRPVQSNSQYPLELAGYDEFFPCAPQAVRYRMAKDQSGRNAASGYTLVDLYMDQSPYDWALCHAGSWIPRGQRYVWVAGHKRHHHPPVHWVKSGRTVGFVPIHPRDVKGKPPLNGKERVFTIDNKHGLSIGQARFASDRPFELLSAPPKEFRNEHMQPLSRAEEPRLAAHQLKDAEGARSTLSKSTGIPLNFDHKSQSFTMTRQVMQGSRTTTVNAPINNHGGNLQSHGGSYGGSGGFNGGGSGGSSHSGGGGGSSSGGGGSHSSGGSSGSSSGGSSVSTSSSSGASSGSSSSSSSGSHH